METPNQAASVPQTPAPMKGATSSGAAPAAKGAGAAGSRPAPPQVPPATPSKIQHSRPGFMGGGGTLAEPVKPVDPNRPLPMAPAGGFSGGGGGGAKITAFGREKRHEDTWTRTPNTTGSGAIHVKTFHCKLTEDAIVYMDQTINEWLDAHPQYEVKFVSSTIGTMTGKLKEPALFCQVWV